MKRLALALALVIVLFVTRTAAADCLDPVAFGALPNDGISDRVAIQQAIDAAPSNGCVRLAPGRWRLDRAPYGSSNQWAGLSIRNKGLTLYGAGAVLESYGDMQLGTMYVVSVDPSAERITLDGLTIDTTGMYNTHEQTHALTIGSGECSSALGTCNPIRDVRIERFTCLHPYGVQGQRKGDCIRLLGNNTATKVENVTIQGFTCRSAARSCIGIQRGVYTLRILDSFFASDDVDQAIDGEATGAGDAAYDYDVTIRGNAFADGSNTQGDWAVTLTNVRGAIVEDNTFLRRGIKLYRVEDVVVRNNRIDATMTSGAGVIESANTCDRCRIEDNTIKRHGIAGYGIYMAPQSGAYPTGVRVLRNTLVLDGNSVGVYANSPSKLTVEGNDISWTGPAPSGIGIFVGAISRHVFGAQIRNNRIEGESIQAAVRVIAYPDMGWFDTLVTGNTTQATTGAALLCQTVGNGGFGFFLTGANLWHLPPACSMVSFVPGS